MCGLAVSLISLETHITNICHNLVLINKDEQVYFSPIKSVILSNIFLLDHKYFVY